MLHIARLERGTHQLLLGGPPAFVSGMRYSVILGGGLLLLGAAYAWLRGPSAAEAVAEDVVDLDADELVLVGAAIE